MPEKELLFSVTDFEVLTSRGHGPGGQHRNKTESAVTIRHIRSGATGYCCSDRSQHRNKENAFKTCISKPEFQKWFQIERAKRLGELDQIEENVRRAMNPANLKIEIQKNGKWIECDKNGNIAPPLEVR